MFTLPILELLQDSFDPPLTAESIRELELALGFVFPKDYVEFLLQFNGGHFRHPVMFWVPNPTDFVNGAIIDSFTGDSEGPGQSGGLLWDAEHFSDRIPGGYLPIAMCNGSDYVVLKFKEASSEFAGVWFWDSAGLYCPEMGSNIFWLAESFTEFLGMLLPDLDAEGKETIPIFQTIEFGNLQTVERFLTEGGDVESRNAEGRTLLMAAAIYSWPKIGRLLLDRSADPNSRDKQGLTPLHHAAKHSIDSVKLLLAAGADAKARDGNGNSVLANWSYRADLVLRSHGAEE